MSTDIQPTEVEVPVTAAAMVEGSSSWEPEAIKQAMGSAFQTLGAGVAAMQVSVTGPPRAVYHDYQEGGTRWTLAFPIADPAGAESSGEVNVGQLTGGRAFRFTHVGPYDGLSDTYGRITAWMIREGHMASEADWTRFVPMWEEYIDDPESTPPEELRTFIYVPRRPA
jgi:hypothetical protein